VGNAHPTGSTRLLIYCKYHSDSNSQYLRICKILGIKAHPARFPNKLPEFFIRLLTDPGDLVVDLFSGSNTTGFVAEQEGRHWISFDNEIRYIASSLFRFVDVDASDDYLALCHQKVLLGESIEIIPRAKQLELLEKVYEALI
jgi:DNA modification methylase